MSHKCVNSVLACLEINWFIQIHLDKTYCATIEPESTQWCQLDAAPIWYIMAYLREYNIL